MKEKQNWALVAAYISQVTNSIYREHDTTKIMETLDNLRGRFRNARASEQRYERRYLDPNNTAMLKTTFFPKIRKTAKKVDKIHTQEEHAQLILDLKVLHGLARTSPREKPPFSKLGTLEIYPTKRKPTNTLRPLNLMYVAIVSTPHYAWVRQTYLDSNRRGMLKKGGISQNRKTAERV